MRAAPAHSEISVTPVESATLARIAPLIGIGSRFPSTLCSGVLTGVDEDYDLLDFEGPCRLFPLPGVVMFPHAVLPLHIFEPRYRQMTQDALAGDQRIAIVQLRPDALRKWAGEPEIESIGCLGKILSHERLPDGRFNLLLHGRKRIRIVRELEVRTLYRQADIEILEDQEIAPHKSLIEAELIELYRHVARNADGLDPDLDEMLDAPPPLGIVTDILAQALGLPASLKQTLLAELNVNSRAERLLRVLRQVTSHLGAKSRPFPPPFSQN